uniref:Uncharacterized protein n=1 Tax=Entomoneis paludosa TaxID=265537 RepID=A0A7S2YAY7_9STRA|mmetsp:Transcript_2553/g.5223  ORF Transcript_2553/g.5223 Transcript_2553/m.5223 type:complete len:131 (+) Transcript_2553:45-437(+)
MTVPYCDMHNDDLDLASNLPTDSGALKGLLSSKQQFPWCRMVRSVSVICVVLGILLVVSSLEGFVEQHQPPTTSCRKSRRGIISGLYRNRSKPVMNRFSVASCRVRKRERETNEILNNGVMQESNRRLDY